MQDNGVGCPNPLNLFCWQNSVTVAKMAKEVMIINKAFWLDENNEVPERGKFSLTSEGLKDNIKCRYKILYIKQFNVTLNIFNLNFDIWKTY